MRAMREKRLLVALVLSLWLTLGQPGHGQGGPPGDPLDRRVRDVHVEAVHALTALSQIAYEYDIPIGVEAASRGQWRAIKIDLQDGTLREVLDAVAAQDPRYGWKVEGGVVNFTPRSDRDDLSADVLGTTVNHIFIEKGTSRASIKDKLLELPAVKAKLEKAGASSGLTGLFGRDYVGVGADFTLRMSNATVREVLNQLIRTSEARYWVVNRYGDNYENFVLNF